MSKRKFLIFVALVLALTTLCWGVVMVSAEDRENRRKDRDDRRDSDRPGPIAAPSLQSGKNTELPKTQGDLAAYSGEVESAGVSGGYASDADREGRPRRIRLPSSIPPLRSTRSSRPGSGLTRLSTTPCRTSARARASGSSLILCPDWDSGMHTGYRHIPNITVVRATRTTSDSSSRLPLRT